MQYEFGDYFTCLSCAFAAAKGWELHNRACCNGNVEGQIGAGVCFLVLRERSVKIIRGASKMLGCFNVRVRVEVWGLLEGRVDLGQVFAFLVLREPSVKIVRGASKMLGCSYITLNHI